MTDRALTTGEVADRLETRPKVVARLARTGQLPGAFREATEWRIPLGAIATLLAKRDERAFPGFPIGWYTITQVAAIVRKPRPTVNGWVYSGVIPCVGTEPGVTRNDRGWWIISGEAMRQVRKRAIRCGRKPRGRLGKG